MARENKEENRVFYFINARDDCLNKWDRRPSPFLFSKALLMERSSQKDKDGHLSPFFEK